MIKQNELLKSNNKILLNLFNEKDGLKLGEFNNTTGTGTKRVKLRFQTRSEDQPGQLWQHKKRALPSVLAACWQTLVPKEREEYVRASCY